MTNYAVADIICIKDGSTTERASTSGFTATTDFDSRTGRHYAIIDLADNTTANFWAAGSSYDILVDVVTVDGVTTGGWVGRFDIGYQGATLDTTIATLASQTSFTLTNGPAEDDALNDMWAIIHDIASAVQWSKVLILDYTGSTKTVTLVAGATFTVAAGDNISVMGPAPMQPATVGRKPVVDASGLIDANTVKIGPTGSGTAQTARDIGAIAANTITNLNTVFNTDYATVYDATRKAFATTSNVKKNTALAAFQFVMIDSTTKVPVPSKTVTVTRSINGGAFGAGTLSAVTELSNGIYGIDFAAGDLNGNVIVLRATATGCDDTIERIITQP
jgi:hypothetical protein